MVLVAVLVLLPTLYVLSNGPILWLQSTGRIGESQSLETFYKPLYWTEANAPFVGPAISSYMEWWAPYFSPMPLIGQMAPCAIASERCCSC